MSSPPYSLSSFKKLASAAYFYFDNFFFSFCVLALASPLIITQPISCFDGNLFSDGKLPSFLHLFILPVFFSLSWRESTTILKVFQRGRGKVSGWFSMLSVNNCTPEILRLLISIWLNIVPAEPRLLVPHYVLSIASQYFQLTYSCFIIYFCLCMARGLHL